MPRSLNLGTNRRIAALLAASVTALAAAACDSNSAGKAPTTPLVVALPSDVTSWDPAAGGDDVANLYFQAVYSSLLIVTPALQLAPSIAKAWTHSPDRKQVTLTLNEGLQFSDDTALDAAAVKANLDRTIKNQTPAAAAFAAIASVDAPTATTVTIKLRQPDPGLLFALGRAPGMIISPKAFDTAKTNPVGSGPYVLDKGATTAGSRYIFTRNPNYRLATKYGFAKLDLRPMQDFKAMVSAVTSKQVDVGGIPTDAVPAAKAAGLQMQGLPSNIIGLWIADRGGEMARPLADVRVRQALNYGLDSTAMLKAVEGGEGTVTRQMFAIDTPAYDKSLNSQYPYDPAKARQLLAAAGYPDGFTLSMPSENAYQPEIYPIVKSQLAQIGVKVQYTPVAPNQIIESYLGGKFPAFLWNYAPSDNWFDVNSLLAPNGPDNPFHTDDPKVRSLMTQIAQADEAHQAPLYRELDAYIVDQAWFAPMYVSSFYTTWKGDKVTADVQPGQLFLNLDNFQPVAG